MKQVCHCQCECETFHHCGKSQREREASEAEAAIAALESALSAPDPSAPTAVDLTLARPGDVCGYSDGGLGLITQQVDRHDGFQWQSSYGVWHRRNGCSNGRGNGGSDIIAVYRDGRLICGTETEGENQ